MSLTICPTSKSKLAVNLHLTCQLVNISVPKCNCLILVLSDWKNAAQAAINAIRATGATNYILVPGNGWTGAASWTDNSYDQGASPKKSNAETMLTIQDSKNKLIFEVHQYFGKSFMNDALTKV